MIADAQCSVITTAPVSVSFTVGGRVAVDETGAVIHEGIDSYVEYSVVSFIAQGPPGMPVLSASITMVSVAIRCYTMDRIVSC